MRAYYDSDKEQLAPMENKISKVGQYVICRCTQAGVHAGRLVEQQGQVVALENSRWLWRWYPASGKWLSGVANHGLAHDKSRVGEPVDVTLTEVCEIISCKEVAVRNIQSCPSNG